MHPKCVCVVVGGKRLRIYQRIPTSPAEHIIVACRTKSMQARVSESGSEVKIDGNDEGE
jgi:hypothetical protein